MALEEDLDYSGCRLEELHELYELWEARLDFEYILGNDLIEKTLDDIANEIERRSASSGEEKSRRVQSYKDLRRTGRAIGGSSEESK